MTHGRVILTKSVATGMKKRTLRSRVMKINKREALSVARTDHMRISDQKILFEIKRAWDTLPSFMYRTFV